MYLAIITLPLLGSIASGLFGRKIGVTGAQLITFNLVILTILLAIAAYFEEGFNSIPASFSVFINFPFNYLNRAKGFSSSSQKHSGKNSDLGSCPIVFNSLDVGYESIKFAFLGVAGVYMLINKKDPQRFYIGSSVNLARRIQEYFHLIKGIRQPNEAVDMFLASKKPINFFLKIHFYKYIPLLLNSFIPTSRAECPHFFVYLVVFSYIKNTIFINFYTVLMVKPPHDSCNAMHCT
jgi:hypothetical protein